MGFCGYSDKESDYESEVLAFSRCVHENLEGYDPEDVGTEEEAKLEAGEFSKKHVSYFLNFLGFFAFH
ncbi:hypothetical protein ACS0TY_023473 [Phlomoides rotata]